MELRQYFAVVRKYLWLILLTTVLATGSAFYVTYAAPSVYRATTTLEIDPISRQVLLHQAFAWY